MLRAVARIFSAALAAMMIICCALPLCAEENAGVLPLSDEEQRFLSECRESGRVFKVGYVQDRIPVSFKGSDGELAGISRFIFDRVAELSGLQFEYAPLPDGEITYDFLMDGKFDLVSSVEYNSENQHARGILVSDPYLSSRKVVVARNGLDFRYDANLSIAVVTGSQTLKKVLAATYPNFTIVDYPSIDDCFAAVRRGESDLMIQNQFVVEYLISKPVNEKLNVIPVIGLDDRLCFSAVVDFTDESGASQKYGETLIGIINKAVAEMTEDEVGSYTIRAIMENQYRYTLGDFLYRYRFAASIFAVAAVIIFVLGISITQLRVRIAENKADARVKSRFLSMMSHELRTPLNGIVGLNHLMSQKTDDPARLGEYLRQSDITAGYLLTLVKDMLDMSGLETDNIELEKRPVELEPVIAAVTSVSKPSMDEKDISFTVRHELSYPCVIADQSRIQQVLLNLIDNANKFTPSGGRVEVRISQEKTPEGLVLTAAEVEDNGSGMSEELKKRIFDTFVKERGAVSKGNQGAGLGLSISRRLARLMGGDITFTSRRGEGSIFRFTFTAEPSVLPKEDSKTGAAKAFPDGGPRILVAEDNELNGEIIMEMLREYGFAAELVPDGEQALKAFEASKPGHFGVILMDLLMPVMDGFEAARAIRLLDRADAKTVKIFACSANSTDDDRAKAAASGMDGFIEKPVDVNVLIEKIKGAEPKENG